MMKVMNVLKEEDDIQNFGYDVSEDELLQQDANARKADMMKLMNMLEEEGFGFTGWSPVHQDPPGFQAKGPWPQCTPTCCCYLHLPVNPSLGPRWSQGSGSRRLTKVSREMQAGFNFCNEVMKNLHYENGKMGVLLA